MTDLYTLSQKRILSAIKYEFIKLNGYNSDYSKVQAAYEAPMQPLTDEVYNALLDEQTWGI